MFEAPERAGVPRELQWRGTADLRKCRTIYGPQAAILEIQGGLLG